MFWRIDLGATGPGLALRDTLAGHDKPDRAARIIAHLAPDILVLSGLDHDHGGAARQALAALIAQHGHDLPHGFAYPSNAGIRTGLDMTGDGDDNSADDTQGYGLFPGQKSLAVLARFAVDEARSRDFSGFLWRDLPDSLSPYRPGGALADPTRDGLQRLSSTGHWDTALTLPDGARLHLLIWQAGPPIFGGDSPRNLYRNHDETAFWLQFLDGNLPMPPPDAPFVLIGGSNLDPHDGDGMGQVMQALLDHPALQDPSPASAGAELAAEADHSRSHRGPHRLDTVHWPQIPGPGNLRVSYILPARDLTVRDAGVFWPLPDTPEAALLGSPDDPPSRHRPVWVDIAYPAPR